MLADVTCVMMSAGLCLATFVSYFSYRKMIVFFSSVLKFVFFFSAFFSSSRWKKGGTKCQLVRKNW